MSTRLKTKVILSVLVIPCFLAGRSQQSPKIYYHSKKLVTSRNGAVVSAHPLASRAGIQILKQGGNAIDAAIATQLALAVVYPGAGNLGGGGFMVARLSNGKNITIDFREKAPAAATRNMYLDNKENVIPGKSENGHLATGVPGSVAGIFTYYKFAKLPFAELIQPAIELAEKGFPITAAEADDLNETQEDFKMYNSVIPVFVKATAWKAGDILIQKDLARTLKRIRDNGAKGFYEGETARLIIEEMKRGRGLISYEDLKNYTAKEREPVVFTYKNDYTLITMPLPASGGILLPQMMRMVEDRNLKSYGFETVPSVHLMAEAERLAYADRAKYLGDVDYFKVPVKTLISYPYIKERMKKFNMDSAGNSEMTGAGVIPESEETTHFNTYDRYGNCVSITTTLNGGYGCRTVVGGAGFLLNNEMDDFSIKPGVPNMYGAVGGEANAIVPEKRMLSSMTPTIVLFKGKPFLVLGTPGGTTITTSVFQTLINIIEFGMSAPDAVNKPKFHHQWLPDTLYIEKGFPQEVSLQLQKMGYKIRVRGPIGRTEVIRIFPTGEIEAVADWRGDDDAEGY
ncbi:MAG TPA: gamma-glutamyltransferase [Puia sp.]|jgi:gamma-glutamyltranspeptidase/glutathione hydrolase|nr:gamma-glutamyltransferase [Puia sp.]